MKKVNREWLRTAKLNKEYKILEINTDKLDFAHEESAKRELVNRVIVKLDLT
jgi:hypothetical protein